MPSQQRTQDIRQNAHLLFHSLAACACKAAQLAASCAASMPASSSPCEQAAHSAVQTQRCGLLLRSWQQAAARQWLTGKCDDPFPERHAAVGLGHDSMHGNPTCAAQS